MPPIEQRRELVSKWHEIGKNSLKMKFSRFHSTYSTTGISYGAKEDDVVNITFPCTSRNIHTLSFYKGDIFFHNHNVKELKALAVMDKLNQPTLGDSLACGCVRYMRFLMDKENVNDVGYGFFHSQAIRELFNYLQNVRKSRKEYLETFPKVIPAAEAIEKKFCDMASKVFYAKATYRTPKRERWNETRGCTETISSAFNLTVKVGKEPSISGFLEEADKSKHTDDTAVINVVLPMSYYSTVLKDNLAVVGGEIVLAKLFDFNNGSFMGLVGKQTYGYKIEATHAILHPERDHVSYITEDKAREIILLGRTPRSRRTKKELGK